MELLGWGERFDDGRRLIYPLHRGVFWHRPAVGRSSPVGNVQFAIRLGHASERKWISTSDDFTWNWLQFPQSASVIKQRQQAETMVVAMYRNKWHRLIQAQQRTFKAIRFPKNQFRR